MTERSTKEPAPGRDAQSEPAATVRAGILVTGTEVITARITDRNGPWVSRRLGELGVEVIDILVVGDRPAELEAGLRFMAGAGAELIVTSGGLGPTADDLTAEIVARFAGVEMVLDEAMRERIERIVAGFGRTGMRFDPEALRASTRKQAMVPERAETIEPAGTAPGLVVQVENGPVVAVLPGPPRELHEMWGPTLETRAVRALLDRTPRYEGATLRLFGIPESELAQSLREVGAETDLSQLEITTCLRRGELEVEIRHRPGAAQARDRLVEAIAERHGPYLFSRDGSTIDEQVARLLVGHRIGLAESCTGGELAARLTEPPGASEYVAGGVVAYANEAKTRLLGVDGGLIEDRGAVSPEVAHEMAVGALARFQADVSVAITGIAGPDGATEGKPVGYVCFCVLTEEGAELARDPVVPGDRAEIRDRSTTIAMQLLRRVLRGEQSPL